MTMDSATQQALSNIGLNPGDIPGFGIEPGDTIETFEPTPPGQLPLEESESPETPSIPSLDEMQRTLQEREQQLEAERQRAQMLEEQQQALAQRAQQAQQMQALQAAQANIQAQASQFVQSLQQMGVEPSQIAQHPFIQQAVSSLSNTYRIMAGVQQYASTLQQQAQQAADLAREYGVPVADLMRYRTVADMRRAAQGFSGRSTEIEQMRQRIAELESRGAPPQSFDSNTGQASGTATDTNFINWFNSYTGQHTPKSIERARQILARRYG